jgi:hypothetical protein
MTSGGRGPRRTISDEELEAPVATEKPNKLRVLSTCLRLAVECVWASLTTHESGSADFAPIDGLLALLACQTRRALNHEAVVVGSAEGTIL